MRNEETLTLLELNRLVRQLIDRDMPREYWVVAELSECRENRGHCYMELIERDQLSATPVARASARCWASRWALVRPCFERTTGQRLQAGMKVLLRVRAQFHEAYGFSWIVTDINPEYTLGDQARRRQDIVRQLKQEGVFDNQRSHALPRFCLRIAVVSSSTAAGYGDFMAHLDASPFAFSTTLFQATMQGEQVEQSILQALSAINARLDDFDCVVIIRGGGAISDMAGFDTLPLAEAVANFELPVITGIGHERDECILDMVSFCRVKTPTAAAALLTGHAEAVSEAIADMQQAMATAVRRRLSARQSQLLVLQQALPRLFSVVKTRQEARLDYYMQRLTALAGQRSATRQQQVETLWQRLPLLAATTLAARRHRLEIAAEKLRMLDPQLLLKRGYSITLKDGHALHDPGTLRPGDVVETRLERGTLKSTVIATATAK